MLISLFYRFLIDFYPKFQPQNLQNSLFFIRKNTLFSKHRLSKLASIWDPIWMPKYLHFPPKIHQNPPINRFLRASFWVSNFASIFYGFWPSFGSQLGPSWPPRRAQEAPKRPLGISFGASRRPPVAKKRLGAAQNPSRPRFGSLRASILEDFWKIYDRFLEDLFMDF